MDNFEIYLPSNTPHPGYTPNTENKNIPSNFIIELPNTYKLDNYDVAMKSISYPNSWEQINIKDSYIKLTSTLFNIKIKSLVCKIPHGIYKNPSNLIFHINRSISTSILYIPDIDFERIPEKVLVNNITINLHPLKAPTPNIENYNEIISSPTHENTQTTKNEKITQEIKFNSRFRISANNKCHINIFPFEEIEISPSLARILGYYTNDIYTPIIFKFDLIPSYLTNIITKDLINNTVWFLENIDKKIKNEENNNPFIIFEKQSSTSHRLSLVEWQKLKTKNKTENKNPYNNSRALSKIIPFGHSKMIDFINSLKKDNTSPVLTLEKIELFENIIRKYQELNSDLLINSLDKPNVTNDFTQFYKNIRFSEFINLNINHNNIYVYCNIVNNIIVGNKEVPLLKIIPIQNSNDNKTDSIIEHDYLFPSFRKIKNNEIKEIKIKLCNDIGKELDFVTGIVIICLVFKKNKDNFLESIYKTVDDIKTIIESKK